MTDRAFGDRIDAKKTWARGARGSTPPPAAPATPATISLRRSSVPPPPAPPSGVDELTLHNEAVSLCFLVNRRSKTMRVIDFRAGPSAQKRICVLKLAKREGVEKAFTLVERDEVVTWMKLGFSKEGTIAGFYKRSDAFLLGCSIDEAIRQLRVWVDREIDDDDIDEPRTSPAALELAEKTISAAKKQAKQLLDRPLPPTKLAVLRDADARKAVERASRAGRALTGFEPFGRGSDRRYFSVTARGSFELVASTESQSCFGNAFLELLSSPRTEAERLATVSALRTTCDRLCDDGVVSCFALAPSDDVGLATAFVYNGFRRTGLLENHVVVGGERRDAIIWSRKLATPAEE